jgi:site-specific DNA-cytosine methylase
MGHEDQSDRGADRRGFDGEHEPADFGAGVTPTAGGDSDGENMDAGAGAAAENELDQDAAADDPKAVREMEALYGRDLNKTRDSVTRWRKQQARQAFRIGEMWADLTDRLTAREVGAFLANECQIPRADVRRYVRLSKVLGEDREFFIENGVAVSVLLDLAGQDDVVRREAVRMIQSGRALQARELRGLKHDIGLARAAATGALDKSRIREFRNLAAERARAAADAWIARLEKLANDAFDLSEHDRNVGNAGRSNPKKVNRMAASATKLLEELPAIAGKSFTRIPKEGDGALEAPNGWAKLLLTLRHMSKKRMFQKEFYERPETTVFAFSHDMVWDLAWVFGHDEDSRPGSIIGRMRNAGAVPLQTDADDASTAGMEPSAPTVLELCAGAGGEAIGLDAAGFRHVGLVEIDPDAAATMRHNRPEWPVIEADLRKADLSALRGVDLLAGGVPCQPYSQAGKSLGAHDERDLFPQALKLVRKLRPKAIMLENVTGTQHVGNAVNRLRILSKLSSLGYDAEWRILAGTDFGLPQKRRRAILVGFQRGTMHRFRWPTPLEKPAPTVGEALYDLMAANGWKHVDAWKERANGYAPTLIGGSQSKSGIDLAQQKSRESWLRIGIDPNGRTRSAPGPNAPADHTPKLTIEMMARIQGFPKDWKFQGVDLQQFHQIANAFPPAMAQAVGLSIMRALTGSEIRLDEALAKPREKRPSLNLGAIRERMKHEEDALI